MESADRQRWTRRSRRRKRSRWTDDDLFEMLAWLEVAMKSDRQGELFKQTIVGHLERSRRKTFTWHQVDQRVEKLWQNHKHGPARNYSKHDCLYRIGLEGLSNVTDNWRATLIQIRRRVADLQANEFRKIPTNKKAVSNKSSTNTPTKARSKRLHESQVLDSESETPFCPVAPRQQKDHASNHGQRPSPGTISRREISQTPTSDKPSFNLERSTRNRSPSISSLTTDSDNLGSSKQASVFEHNVEGHLQTRSDSPVSGWNWQGPAKSASANSWAYGRQQCFQQPEIDTLCQELISVQEFNAILKARLERASVDMKMEEKLQTMEKELAESRAQIQYLKSVINDKDRYAPFTKKLALRTFRFDAEPLKAKMLHLRVVMQQGLTLDCPELYEPCKINFFAPEGELSTLLERVLGKAKVMPPNLDILVLIHALISASICQWVFETDLQDTCLASTPVLEECLSHLRLLDGIDAVRNLHFAANTSIIQSDYFQNYVIPKKADVLAKHLIIVLKPLFTQHMHEKRWTRDVYSLWEEQKSRLQKIFNAALRIKSQVVISKAIFEADLPIQGSPFLSEHMDQSGTVLKEGKTQSVLVTLVPGLRVFASNAALVDYNNFRKVNSDPAALYDHVKRPLVQILQK